MAVNNTQYLSFLGGLVSPRLWLRSDMDKFGKWFATADNIRFHTVGSFENRFGTIKIGNTYRNTAGENIKLIKFDFGQGETCMLELGSGYFRVIASVDNEWKYVQLKDENDDDIDFVTIPLSLSDTDDVKYVQSGDIIFLTNQNGIYEIKRLTKDFTRWEMSSFSFTDDIVPYGDENDNDTHTLTAVNSLINDNWNINIPVGVDDVSRIANVTVSFVGNNVTTTYTSAQDTWLSISDFVTDISSTASSRDLSVSYTGNSVTFNNSGSTTVETIQFSFQYMGALNTVDTFDAVNLSTLQELYSVVPNKYRYNNGNNVSFHSEIIIPGGTYTSGEFTNGFDVTPVQFNATQRDSVDDMISSINNDIASKANSYYGVDPTALNILLTKISSSSIRFGSRVNVTGSYNGNEPDAPTNSTSLRKFTDIDGNQCLRNKCKYNILNPTVYNTTISKSSYSAGYYDITSSNFNMYADKQNGETFMVRNTVDADFIHATKTGYTTSTVTTETSAVQSIKSDGFWRYNSSGLWSGEVKLQYSTDNSNSWTTFFIRKNSTHNQYSTTNDNTSGNIKTDGGTILLRMVVSNITEDSSSKFAAELAVDKFEINSVYKIYSKASNSTAVVKCVKGDIGAFTGNSNWREAEFSSAKGYPTAIGFYQNRLFLGKEYKLYSSRINDFWDFYEPIEVADDDPMTMSLLSYKVNNIQNLIGIRSFFVFTSGGEFGIGAEGGALTQATKYLKQISAHGSNSCNPIFCGDIIVFVDKTNNTVRAFRYSLEADGWEATDVSVLIEQVLEGKKIITTEYMQDTKECLFLTDEGEVYVFKFFQEQNIAAWSVWKHAKYKITNLCVLEDSLGKDILYIAVNTNTGMQIEQFNPNYYCDSVETFSNETEFDSVTTTFQENDKVVVNDGTDLYLAEVGESGVVSLRNNSTYAAVGLSYTSTATLLSPEIQDRDGTFSTFNRKRPFKVYCFYRDSYGFKVGVEEGNKQEIQFQPVWSDVDSETDLTTGKTSVLIPARYDGSSRVSFVQEKPYPMIIENILLETDYGGK